MPPGAPTPHQGSPPPPQVPSSAASPPSKRDLKSWWKGFKIQSKHQDAHETRPQGIFGVPLRQSITYANVAISLVDENGKSYIYGYVPIIVAKCGVFLKEKATHVEGIFRLSGSEKRIKELKTIFDSPDRYGKGLVWDGFTVHDAANVLRRYLNDLPEPVVPLDLYDKFREPLRGATKQAVGDAEGPQFVENFDERAAIEKYQQLITELPPLNRQLLLYILDLLAVFAAKSDENRMNSQNLAAIFQPGMLSHPAHAMFPEEYRLNQCVIIFLIENQDHFLIGMQGTAADEKTMQEVAMGSPAIEGSNSPMTPSQVKKSSLGRSGSNASAGAESVRRHGMVRRNRSTSSRHSRQETGATTPGSPGVATTPTGGLTRSNTVPSKKSPALPSGRFQMEFPPGSEVHANTGQGTVAAGQSPAASSIVPAAVGTSGLAPGSAFGGRSQERLLDPHYEPAATPSKERGYPTLFQRSPTSDSDRRQPNKLKKKRIPGSKNHSAQSSTSSLPQSTAISPNVEVTNPIDQHEGRNVDSSLVATPQPSVGDTPSEPTPQGSQVPPNNTLHPENTLKTKKSPPTSLHSSFNEGSDLDQFEGPPSTSAAGDHPEKEKKRRWRLSRKKEEAGPISAPITSPKKALGTNSNADVSSTSIGSGANKPRKSLTNESADPPVSFAETQMSHDSKDRDKENREIGKDEPKGPLGWIKSKYRVAKETAEQRRNKSPPADRQPIGATALLPARGKSIEVKREEDRQPQVAPQAQVHPVLLPAATDPPPARPE